MQPWAARVAGIRCQQQTVQRNKQRSEAADSSGCECREHETCGSLCIEAQVAVHGHADGRPCGGQRTPWLQQRGRRLCGECMRRPRLPAVQHLGSSQLATTHIGPPRGRPGPAGGPRGAFCRPAGGSRAAAAAAAAVAAPDCALAAPVGAARWCCHCQRFTSDPLGELAQLVWSGPCAPITTRGAACRSDLGSGQMRRTYSGASVKG